MYGCMDDINQMSCGTKGVARQNLANLATVLNRSIDPRAWQSVLSTELTPRDDADHPQLDLREVGFRK